MEDFIQDSAPSEFHEKGFWDEFYQRRGDKAFEWYGNWSDCSSFVLQYASPDLPVLVLGCGNSTLSEDMHFDGGFTKVVSIDFSEDVVSRMQLKTQTTAHLEWEVMDITKMTFPADSFGCVMDKGALDALYSQDVETTARDVEDMFNEVERVLCPSGVYVCVTMAQDYVISRLLHHFGHGQWRLDIHTFVPQDGTMVPAFLCAATKGQTGIFLHDPLQCASGDSSIESILHAVQTYQEKKAVARQAAVTAMPIKHDLRDFEKPTRQDEDDSDDEPLTLSAAALAALADFAVERGILEEGQVNAETLIMDVSRGCDMADKEDEWTYDFDDIHITLRGLKRELGQTLMSTGLTLWTAADQLAEFIHVHREEYITGRAVVELGCGLGLVGILTAKCGAKQVVLTDGAEDAFALLQANVATNFNGDTSSHSVYCELLDWGDEDRLHALVAQYGKYDTVLAADVCYSEAALIPLFQCAAALLNSSGTFLLSYTQRGVHPDHVFGAAKSAGFEWKVLAGAGDPGGVYSMHLKDPVHLCPGAALQLR